ncbi:hypothetical protein [Sphingobacterium yanglingense]|uniref:hypothetical protein n=1 Tax=Sphingobacterium yanglingense TaxID=1437280 RepID=UPI001FE56473|nr:hypothetical protein [Sphingobacterium yanglingense]
MQNLLQDVRKQIFNAPANTIFNRGLQRAYVDRLGVLLKLDKPVQETSYASTGLTPYNPNLSDMRILIIEELDKLEKVIAKYANRKSGFEKRHYQELLSRISQFKTTNK